MLSTKEEPSHQGPGLRRRRQRLPRQAARQAGAGRPRPLSLRGYIAQLERNEAYRKLAESQRRLAQEVAQAAKYVASLLPAPLPKRAEPVDWRFIPSTQLGGDSFGYHWLDDDHFAVYLLDVSGHGVGAVAAVGLGDERARLAGAARRPISATPARCWPASTTPSRWRSTITSISRSGMASISKGARRLVWAGGGHPPAVLVTGPDRPAPPLRQLKSQGGGDRHDGGHAVRQAACDLGPYAELYLFSDGVFEIERPDGAMWTYDEFVASPGGPAGAGPLDRLLAEARTMHGSETLADDFSILQVGWPGG